MGSINFIKDVRCLYDTKDMEYAYYESYLSQKKGLIAAPQKFCNQFLYSNLNEQKILVAKTILLKIDSVGKSTL